MILATMRANMFFNPASLRKLKRIWYFFRISPWRNFLWRLIIWFKEI